MTIPAPGATARGDDSKLREGIRALGLTNLQPILAPLSRRGNRGPDVFRKGRLYLPLAWMRAHVSRSVTVRLKTGWPARASESGQK